MSAQRLFNKTSVHMVCLQQNKPQVGRRTLPDCRVLTHGRSCCKQSRGKTGKRREFDEVGCFSGIAAWREDKRRLSLYEQLQLIVCLGRRVKKRKDVRNCCW